MSVDGETSPEQAGAASSAGSPPAAQGSGTPSQQSPTSESTTAGAAPAGSGSDSGGSGGGQGLASAALQDPGDNAGRVGAFWAAMVAVVSGGVIYLRRRNERLQHVA